MSADFDFGNFLDLQNQATLKINCLRLFEHLCIEDGFHKKVEALKKEIINDPISESFSGFYESISNFRFGNHESTIKVFPHLCLMISTLNDDDASVSETTKVKKKLAEKLADLYNVASAMYDIWIIAQIHEFIEPGSKLAINLIRIIDLNLSDPSLAIEIRNILKGQNVELNMEQFLSKLLAQETRGFITGEWRQVLLERGVQEKFVNLITKESVKNLTKDNLANAKLFLISFKEDMLDNEPDFVDKITQNGIILTSTAAESEKGFIFLVMSTNDESAVFFKSYSHLISEVG